MLLDNNQSQYKPPTRIFTMASMTAQLLGTAQKIVPPRRRKSSMTAQLLGVKPMPEMPKPPKHLVKTVKAQEMRDCDEVCGTRFDNWRDFEGSLSPVTAPSLRIARIATCVPPIGCAFAAASAAA